MIRASRTFIGLAASFLVTASLAQAGTFTSISGPAKGEPSIAQIFSTFYGGPVVANGNNLTNGVYTATRLDDDSLGSTGLGDATASKSDQIWTSVAGQTISFRVYSIFSSGTQEFGYLTGLNDLTFNSLGTVYGNKFKTIGNNSQIDIGALTGGTFRWARNTATAPDAIRSSQNADNFDALDHMVSYKVTGDATPHWLLFFEDGRDRDFNDFAVEVNIGGLYTPPNWFVPLPAMVWPGLATLGGLAVMSLRRKNSIA